jgi:hypothetical protein
MLDMPERFPVEWVLLDSGDDFLGISARLNKISSVNVVFIDMSITIEPMERGLDERAYDAHDKTGVDRDDTEPHVTEIIGLAGFIMIGGVPLNFAFTRFRLYSDRSVAAGMI